MYEELNKFAESNNFTFSSEKFVHVSKRREAIAIIEKFGLKVNKKKTRLTICNHTRIAGAIIHENTKEATREDV